MILRIFPLFIDESIDIREGFISFLKQAAESGSLHAQYEFFSCYRRYYQNDSSNIRHYFSSNPEDLDLALEFGMKLAEAGFLIAQIDMMGIWYRGLGVEKNIDKAMEYFNKAIEQHPNGNSAIATFFEQL